MKSFNFVLEILPQDTKKILIFKSKVHAKANIESRFYLVDETNNDISTNIIYLGQGKFEGKYLFWRFGSAARKYWW